MVARLPAHRRAFHAHHARDHVDSALRFIIFDDIEGDPNPDYRNLMAQWNRAFPGSKPVRLGNDHPIFNCFFNIDLSKIPSKMRRVPAEYLGIFEDNDPRKRLVAIIDNYADIGEFIEFSDEG